MRRNLDLTANPFRIGRQADCDLVLRDGRISRQHAQIVFENGKHVLEDLGSRHGTFVNQEKVTRRELHPNDTIEFGAGNSFQVIFSGEEKSIEDLLERVDSAPPSSSSSRELYHLGVLLEAAGAIYGHLLLEDMLAAVVDAAIRVTGADRGVLLLEGTGNELQPSVARESGQRTLPLNEVRVSTSVLRQVAETRRELVVADIGEEHPLREQASIVIEALRTLIAIPLERQPTIRSVDSTVVATRAGLLGVLYLDSRRPLAAFSELDRQVLRSLAAEAATVVENARLFADARERERLQRELEIASEIQMQLLPKTLPRESHLVTAGRTLACRSVGGDCYDVVELPEGMLGFVVADVAGKGMPAALLASMLMGSFCATASNGVALSELAHRVNKRVCDRTDEQSYATLFYGVVSPGGLTEYFNAGHVPPLVRRHTGELIALDSDSFPIGMFDFAEYASRTVQLEPGDFLVMYSDGVTEAVNPESEMFGDARLREAVKKFKGSTAEELLDAVFQAVRVFTAGFAQADDVTVVVVQYHGAQPA
ncbi:MAG TPA: SpoIIE family protein phosphatase [Candidatus Acidoferrales bacterium]|nr:SpoIIE family protein phosphatase [Candidatus Acidoferrales bacterium]